MQLLTPVAIGPRTARNRLLFGPHETNLGDGRSLSARHLAYYRRRAAGGTGIIVTEAASVHPSDWPYERSPLAEQCGDGWAAISSACQAEGSLVLAGLNHAGGQGSSAYSQLPLWAPSRVPEVGSREVPKWMEPEDIAAVVAGFGAAAKIAADAGVDGVEVNAGQHSLIRQFLSGLTNHRGDEWGQDRSRFAREVLGAVRDAIGPDRVLALRLSCDEMAPWAGIKPEDAPAVAEALLPWVDLLVVVRGSIYTVSATRPDTHEAPGFNVGLCKDVRSALHTGGHAVPVALQGSVVEWGQAEWAVGEGDVADVVEMTRAFIAEPELGTKLAAGTPEQVRPCILCNQQCIVRDARNPIVTCVGEPSSGHETEDPSLAGRAARPRQVLVVGGGPAGLECARVAASRGHHVRLVERGAAVGGAVLVAAAGAGRARLATLVGWLEAECRRLGVTIHTGHELTDQDIRPDEVVVVANGSRPGVSTYDIAAGARVVDVADALADPAVLGDGPVVVHDPIGGPIAISLAELLGARGTLITQDNIAGNELSRSGDLAPANVRLQQLGATIVRRALLREVTPTAAVVEDKYSGQRTELPCSAFVDAGFRLPDESVWERTGRRHLRAGDCVAPRTIHEAVLEGRRAALALESLA
jgi:mycofactocin system FadH/OYE family oxidoreductase 1